MASGIPPSDKPSQPAGASSDPFKSGMTRMYTSKNVPGFQKFAQQLFPGASAEFASELAFNMMQMISTQIQRDQEAYEQAKQYRKDIGDPGSGGGD